MRFTIKLAKWIPAALIVAASWYLSSLEKIDAMPSFPFADKAVHCICFAGLAFWVAFACRTARMKEAPLPAALTSAYGIIDEIHQSMTPGRECSFWDWATDTLGAALGAACFVLLSLLVVRIFSGKGEGEASAD